MAVYGIITNLLITTSFIINFFASQIHLGLKGVSIPVFPLFIPRNQIVDYDIFKNTLVLRRKGKKYFKTQLR